MRHENPTGHPRPNPCSNNRSNRSVLCNVYWGGGVGVSDEEVEWVMGVWKEIRCDSDRNNPDCWSNNNNGPMGYYSATELRGEAKDNGWLISRKGDFCPVCRATTPQEIEQ